MLFSLDKQFKIFIVKFLQDKLELSLYSTATQNHSPNAKDTNMLVLGDAHFFRVNQHKTPMRVSGIYVALGPKCKFLALAMYISCFFVFISFALGNAFSVEYGLKSSKSCFSFHTMLAVIYSCPQVTILLFCYFNL